MLLASSRVKELTLIFRADKLLAAPLPLLPPLGGKPPNPEEDGPGPAAAALYGPGPAPLPNGTLLLLLGSCPPEPMGLSGLLLLGMLLPVVIRNGDPACWCCCWWSAPPPTFLRYCVVSSLWSFLVKPCTQQIAGHTVMPGPSRASQVCADKLPRTPFSIYVRDTACYGQPKVVDKDFYCFCLCSPTQAGASARPPCLAGKFHTVLLYASSRRPHLEFTDACQVTRCL